MSQENVELVRRALEGFVALEPDVATLAEDVEICDHDILDAGDYRGLAGFARWMEDWSVGLPVIGLELQEFIDAGDAVVAVCLLKARGRGSSMDVERQDGIVFRCREGKIVRLDYFNSRDQALKAVGLKE